MPENGLPKSLIAPVLFPGELTTGVRLIDLVRNDERIVATLADEINKNHPGISKGCNYMAESWDVPIEEQSSFYAGCLFTYKFFALQAENAGVELPDSEEETLDAFFNYLLRMDAKTDEYCISRMDDIEANDAMFMDTLNNYFNEVEGLAPQDKGFVILGCFSTYDMLKFQFHSTDVHRLLWPDR